MRLLVVDTETSGLDPYKHGLLQLAGAVWDDGTIKDSISINLIADETFDYSPEAMYINEIDVEEHNTSAISRYDACCDFDDFVLEQFGEKATLVGHNVGFDYGFISQMYRLSGGNMLPRMRYRMMDTHSLALALQLADKIPAEQKLDLTSLCDYFNIHVTGRHTALGDAVATAELLTKLIYFTKWGRNSCHYCGPSISPKGKVPLDEL
jgi:DNA polymerase III epsilon subunit-like protein